MLWLADTNPYNPAHPYTSQRPVYVCHYGRRRECDGGQEMSWEKKDFWKNINIDIFVCPVD